MMLKIGVTQRVEFIEKHNETRDALDQSWTKLLEENGFIVAPIPNTCQVHNFIEALELDGIIISGGNDHSTRMHCEISCIDYCVKHALPLLGICHGMQFIGQYFGAKLVHINNHVATQHDVTINTNQFKISIGNFTVNSYHNFTLDKVPDHFVSLATDNEGHCEAMYHQNLPIVTFMWHPERQPYLSWFNNFIKQFYAKH